MINKLIFALAAVLACTAATAKNSEMQEREKVIRIVAYQAKVAQNTLTNLFTPQPGPIENGDHTKLLIMAGGFQRQVPELQNAVSNKVSSANAFDAEAMDLLKVDRKAWTVTNQFGGVIRVISESGNIVIEYGKAPKFVCDVVKTIRCQ